MDLTADSIEKSYGECRILSSASLRVRSGEIVGVIGRIGSGKTTLLRICGALTKPDSGWVQFTGSRSTRPSLARLSAAGLHFVSAGRSLPWRQKLASQFKDIRARYVDVDDSAIERLGVTHFLDKMPTELSGGELRRLEIATAMFRKPRCLIIDDLFRGLDPITSELVSAALKFMAKASCAILISGHELSTVFSTVTSVTWLTDATTNQLGSPEEAMKNDRFRVKYLGT